MRSGVEFYITGGELFYELIMNYKKAWNICFIICHQHQARSGKIKANKMQRILVKTQVFFVKTELQYI